MRLFFAAFAAALFVTSQTTLFVPRMLAAPSATIVISQVYGGGGNAGAPLTHDYIELFNRGSGPVSLAGWSLQYTSATGTGNFGASASQITELPAISLNPGQYLLVQEAQGTGPGAPLPAPDAIDSTPINMSGTAGKVALVNSTTPLGCNGGSTPCSAAALATIVDLVGYGTANFFEGASAAPTLSNTTAAFRADSGCTDTDENGNDFTAAGPAPRNTASPIHPCTGGPAISIGDVAVSEGDSGTVTASFTLSLSSPAGSDGVTFDVATADGTATVADADYAGSTLSGQTIPAGQQTYSFDVQVFGDADIEANETFLVNVTNVVGATAGDTQAVGTITNDDFATPVFDVVISQVYGGGGNSGATLKNDFIELFNRGTATVDLSGWSVQYMSATGGATWFVTPLAGSIGAGQYYLVQQAAGSGGSVSLPPPDATGSILMAAGAGKVALSSSAGALSGTCPSGASIVDLVGYGAASCFEGSAPTFAASNTLGAHRKRGGCFDSNDNAADFLIAAPAPRNSASPGRSCDYAAAAVHEIQGSGLATPFLNQDVTTTGIVTARKTNGFFVQTADTDTDADPATSQALFVFTSTLPSVSAGDAVAVKGTATEFFNLTQLQSTLPGDVVVESSGHSLPVAVVLTATMLDPNGAPQQLERFEGMRMHAPALVSVAPTNGFGETTTVLPGVARPMREPGIEVTLPVPPDPTSGTTDCCIPRFDRNPERIMIDSDGVAGAQPITVTSHVTFTDVTGPLDFTFGDYKVLPETPPATGTDITAVPVPDPLPGEFTVAGFNIENFAGGAAQRQKAALAIGQVMRSPDLIGHIEISTLESLQALAAQVNADAAAGGGPNPAYEAFLIPASPTATQNLGFLVKTSRIQVDSVTQERAADTFVNPLTGATELLHDRPPLVLRATVDPAGADPRRIVVVVNHLRSFIDVELVDGEGIRVRAKRTAQAESLAGLLQELQTANPGTAIISIGDYNAFQFNDGYTDPIAVIQGAPTPDDQIVVDESPDLVNPNFINLTNVLPPASRYTFVFEGTPQALDHVLVNTVAHSYVQRYAIARANADFPEHPAAGFAGNPARPERSSDHDMPVAYFNFPPRETTTTVSPVSVTYDVGGQSVVLSAQVAAIGKAISEGTITFTVETSAGAAVGTALAAVSEGVARASVTLPGTVEPQALVVTASFSGGATTLPGIGTGTLTVKYGVCLLYDPAKAITSGAAYPIRIQLCDVSGVNVSRSGVTVTALEVEGVGTANPGGEFRFNRKLTGYIFTLDTGGLAPGSYNLSFVAGDDPTVHVAGFTVK